jgi:hypothetical protein
LLKLLGDLNSPEESSPKLAAGAEFIVGVTECREVKHRQKREELLEVRRARAFSREGLSVDIQKLPLRDVAFFAIVPSAAHSHNDRGLTGNWVQLYDVRESFVNLLSPIVRPGLLQFDLNGNRVTHFRVEPAGAKMHVIFGKASSALAPPASERDTDRLQDRSLASIVRADENRRGAELYLRMPN